jgi:hypothetical protein
MTCQHKSVRFMSGGFYIGCSDCGAVWIAIKSMSDPQPDHSRSGSVGMSSLRVDPTEFQP